MGGVAKKKITKLGCEKCFCRVTYCTPVGMLYTVLGSSSLSKKKVILSQQKAYAKL
jgi:hypothetical protein